jgi:hypothetical protein
MALTQDQFRRLALAFPGTAEGAHQKHPDFRCNGRIFASLHQDGLRAMVRLPLPVQMRVVADGIGAAAPATGAWGRAGCTMVELAALTSGEARAALAEAWQLAQAAGATKAKRAVSAKRSTNADPAAEAGRRAGEPGANGRAAKARPSRRTASAERAPTKRRAK